MNTQKRKTFRRQRRKIRVRKRVAGTAERPRLSILRSLKNLGCQLIDDDAGVTLLSLNTLSPEFRQASGSEKHYGGNCAASELLGTLLAGKAKERGIGKIVLDRSGHRYHGRIKALADALRKNGLEF